MGMLDRYQKAGGFLQLLQLVETRGPTKQKQFLELIAQESKVWEQALRQRMLSFEKIINWDDNSVGEIFSVLPILTASMALHGMNQEQKDKALKTLSHSHKRKILDQMEMNKPGPAEISTAYVKVIEETRSLISHGKLRLDRIDPQLVIPTDIEEKLTQSSSTLITEIETSPSGLSFGELEEIAIATLGPAVAELAENPPPTVDQEVQLKEIQKLRTELRHLHQEKKQLLQHIETLQKKIDQIHKLSA